MRKKLNVKLLFLVLLAVLSICSCTREDLLQQETPKERASVSSAKYASRSLWKEDDVYIGKVQQVFLKYANLEKVKETYGELYWNYAMSFGQFGEKYLLVPVVKKDKVVLLMEAVRKGDRLYFYEKNDTDLLTFFQHVLYSNIISHSEVIDGNEAAAKAKYVCSTRTIVIGCLNGQTDCEPVSYSQMVCEWKEGGGNGIPPKSFDPLGDPFGGGGGGGGSDGYEYPDPPEETTPCKKATERNTNAKSLLNKDKIKEAKTKATATISTDETEKAFSFGTDSNGDYQTSEVVSGSSNSTSIPSGNFTIEGTAHTHLNGYYNAFSNGDLYTFQAANASHSTLLYAFAFASDGSAYLLTITDPVKYAAFVAQFPSADNIDSNNGFVEGTDLYTAFWNAHKQFVNQGLSDDSAFANATAHILNKYDAGATLSQQDSDGNFNSIFVNETVTPANSGGASSTSTFTKTSDCNLK